MSDMMKNVTTDFELLSAYVDHELDQATRQHLEARLAQEPELKAQLSAIVQSQSAVQAAFSALDDEPLPAGLEAMIANAEPEPMSEPDAKPELAKSELAQVLPFKPKQAHKRAPSWFWASAASVLLAFGVWWLLPTQPGALDASLVAALNTQPSGTVVDLNPELRVEIVATYQYPDQSVCRALLEHSPKASRPARACLKQGTWQLEKSASIDGYQTASSHELSAEHRLNAEQERAWLKQH